MTKYCWSHQYCLGQKVRQRERHFHSAAALYASDPEISAIGLIYFHLPETQSHQLLTRCITDTYIRNLVQSYLTRQYEPQQERLRTAIENFEILETLRSNLLPAEQALRSRVYANWQSRAQHQQL